MKSGRRLKPHRGSFARTRATVKGAFAKLDQQHLRLDLLRRYRLAYEHGECTAQDIKHKVWDATAREMAFMTGKGGASWNPNSNRSDAHRA